ncbi:hypothetical protein HYX14_05455, partial [Candidatus Woesearchaeota archaeon]|nr:hypothetical protein [Candidatus Woesearchaeota archaeon]
MRRAIVSGLVGLLLSCTPGVQGTAVTKYRAADSLRTVGDVVSQEQKDIVEVTDEGADILGAKHDSGYATDAAPDSDNSHDASSYTSDDSSLGQDAGCSDTGDAPECYTADIPRVDIWSPPRVDIGPVTIKEVGVPDYGITEGENTAEIYTTPEVDEGEVEGVLDEVSLNYEVDLPIQEDIILPEDTLSSMEESDVAKDTLDTLITPGECVPSEYQPVYGTEAWEIISTEGEQSFTYSVWGSDEKNVFFAGNGAAGRLLQYDGENLNMVVPYKEYSVLFAVWGTGSKVYAAG